MTLIGMIELKNQFKEALEIDKAIHLHDDDNWNEITISYHGIIVGSELVSKEDCINYIIEMIKKGY